MKYCCEFCGKTFEKEGVALECEKKHKEEQERSKKLEQEKDKRYKEIKAKFKELIKLVSDFSYDYNENIHIRW
jgi:uncharacterized protein YaiL (DUF2058 family)